MKPIDLDTMEIKLPKASEIPTLLKQKWSAYKRVFKITKKPSMTEFQSIVKVTGIGILLIGLIGFIIFMIVELLQ